ncbi:MAG: hypothetical protein M3P22_00285 [bacterium]|nr:hypothetical protein [bacterium]
MDNKSRNIIIIIAVLVLLSVGLYYSRLQKQKTENTDNTENADATIQIPANNDKIPENKTENTPANSQQSPEAQENQRKFNTAMSDAQKAFVAKQYAQAIVHYKTALTYNIKKDTVYQGLSLAYAAQGDWVSARTSIDSAITINPLFVELWTWKLTILDEKTNTSFADLKKIYQDGLTKVDPKTKINLVTSFARIAENNQQNGESIALWQYAIELYPQNTTSYQAEIDRLKA